jgi:CubicO group peptidase (beta-lactamase class C family)
MHGSYDIGFEEVADAFRLILANASGGGAVSIWLDGRAVVDLAGGLSDLRTGRPWDTGTAALIFSCTKALVATCVHRAAQDGLVDLDRPIARYWPEFGSAGKAEITPRMVLAHRAGIPALDVDLDLPAVLATEPILRALEAQQPLWHPGDGHSYHAMTYGWILGELLRRATGRSLADHFADAFGHAGATWLGRPDSPVEVAHATWHPAHSNLEFPPDSPEVDALQRALTRGITLGSAFSPRLVGHGDSDLNSVDIQRHGLPSLGAVSTASSLARVWYSTIRPHDGRQPLLSPTTITDATSVLAEGPPALGNPPPWPRWSSGYMLDSEFSAMLSAASFGHDGAGGQLAFADADAGVGFAFLTNDLRNVADDRSRRLVAALARSLGLSGR